LPFAVVPGIISHNNSSFLQIWEELFQIFAETLVKIIEIL